MAGLKLKFHLSYGFLALSLSLAAQQKDIDDLLKSAFHQRRNLDSALYYSNQAHLISRELGFTVGMDRSKVQSGLAYYNSGQIDTATTLLYGALPALIDFPFDKGLAHWYIGKIQTRTRSFDEGASHYQKALKAFEEVDSTLFVGYIYTSLGVIEGMQNNYTNALEWFTSAYELKFSLGMESDCGPELDNISLVYMRMGSFKKSIEYAWKSIRLQADDSDDGSYINLGGIYNMMGKPDSALYYYDLGYSTAVSSGNEHNQQSGLINISNVLYQFGKHLVAIEKLKKALNLNANELSNRIGIYIELGKNFRKLNRLDSAAFYLQQGYRLGLQSKNKMRTKEASLFLSYLFADSKQFDSAFYYLTQNLAYSDSINNENIQGIFADQRVKLETLKKQQEIEALTQENEWARYRQLTLIGGSAFLGIIGLLGFMQFRTRSMLKQKQLVEEKHGLQQELEQSKVLLSSHTLSMIHRKNVLVEIENQLASLDAENQRKIKNIIQVNTSLEKDWDNFQNYFSQVYGQFFESLNKKFPMLSQNETRLAALIKMNLANREIATLLNIEAKSVKMARYRLRKRFELPDETDLNSYLQNLV